MNYLTDPDAITNKQNPHLLKVTLKRHLIKSHLELKENLYVTGKNKLMVHSDDQLHYFTPIERDDLWFKGLSFWGKWVLVAVHSTSGLQGMSRIGFIKKQDLLSKSLSTLECTLPFSALPRDVHQIDTLNGVFYAVSTTTNSLITSDFSTYTNSEHFNGAFDFDQDHFNSITTDGKHLFLLAQNYHAQSDSWLLNLSTEAKILIHKARCVHNYVFADEGPIFNNSFYGKVHKGDSEFDVKGYFPRGLAYFSSDLLVSGLPILVEDRETREKPNSSLAIIEKGQLRIQPLELPCVYEVRGEPDRDFGLLSRRHRGLANR